MGRPWRSEPGAGVWLTIVERPSDVASIELLSLRVGLALSRALDRFSESPVRLKWPNDLYVGERKLAGVLIEARWREARPDWVAIGVGINLRPPASEPRAAGLRAGTTRNDVLERVVPGIRAAAAEVGPLSDYELAAYADRDFAAGRACTEPAVGIVQGINAVGSLLVKISSHGAPTVIAVRAGSLVLRENQ